MQSTFRIGEEYHVEPPLNRVTGPRGTNRLEPKVMTVLVCLAEHPGQVVSKDRLLHSAWADTAVGDDVLTRAVSELRRVFEDDPKQPRVIETIPKSGYRLIAPVQFPAPPPRVETDNAADSQVVTPWRSVRYTVLVGLSGVVVVALTSVWLLRPSRSAPARAVRVVSLTAMSGSEFGPAFSPDGRQIAFAWDGDDQRNFDIYVKLVGSSEVRRLTTDAGTDLAAQWSPDGRQIAYVRAGPASTWTARVMSSLGGSDRKVSDFPVWLPAIWSTDGRYLVAGRAGPADATHSTNGLYLIPIQGGEPRAITRPPAPGRDQGPAFSPDGRRLAYSACDEYRTNCFVQVLDLDPSFGAVGAPRRLTGPLRMPQSGLTWSHDGRFVIFNAEDVQLNYLWRVSVDGDAAPERIEVAGVEAFFPSIPRSGNVLGFTRKFHDEDVYRFDPRRAAQP